MQDTALHLAALGGHVEAMKILIEANAIINALGQVQIFNLGANAPAVLFAFLWFLSFSSMPVSVLRVIDCRVSLSRFIVLF